MIAILIGVAAVLFAAGLAVALGGSIRCAIRNNGGFHEQR